jgi:polysaccharide export outer membrane protein
MMTIRRSCRLALALCSSIVLFAGSVLPAAAQKAPETRAAPATPVQPPAGAHYRLAAGDSIRISVFQSPELSVETRLTESGTISYPLLGTVQLGGLSISEAEKKIADGLRTRDFVKQPQVSILVTQVRGHQVSVLGQVGRPGRYPLETGEVRLTEMLATAGGVQPTGADTVVVIGSRRGQPFRQEVDLPAVYAGKVADDVMLQNGDSIYVERAPQIYVQGEVGRAGPIRLERNMTVRQAIAAAGGITIRGTERGMKVHRKDTNGKVQEIPLRMTDTLQADDVIHIRESLF